MVRPLHVALAAAVAASVAAGWLLLRTGPAAPPPADAGGGTGPGPGDGASPLHPGPGNGGSGGAVPGNGGGVEEMDPEDDSDLDRPLSGPEGGASTEDILAAIRDKNWLEVERLLRNGGSEDSAVTEALLKGLDDLQYRNKVATLAGFLKDPGALARFLELAKTAKDPNTRAVALEASARIGGPGVMEALTEALATAKPGSILASSAAGALGTLGTPEAAMALVARLRNSHADHTSPIFLEALARVRNPDALAELGRFALDEGQDARLRAGILASLGRTKQPAVLPDLLRAARESKEPEIRSAAYVALAHVGEPEGVRHLVDLLHAGDDGQKQEAAFALQNLTSRVGGAILTEALERPLPEALVPYLVTALGRSGTKESIPALSRFAADPDLSDGARVNALRAMAEIGDGSARPTAYGVLESSTRAGDGVRNAAVGVFVAAATAEDLPRLEKILGGMREQTAEWHHLKAVVERLRRSATRPGK
jgi:HEAT repeat protein